MDSPATWSKVKRVSGCPNQVMVWGPSCRRHLVAPFPAASVPVRGRVRIKTCHHQRLTWEAQAVFEDSLRIISHMMNLHNTLSWASYQPASIHEIASPTCTLWSFQKSGSSWSSNFASFENWYARFVTGVLATTFWEFFWVEFCAPRLPGRGIDLEPSLPGVVLGVLGADSESL